uniref:TIR domain-containing protein n=1 Tax=uncultured Thiotrichaceae bacterium TaxID=298394 RepID=A0A6S6UAD0_9GAMM|nr:MAG: TIR domain-containing protein [uncultured Thiotrichaceae bacterium]
MNSKTSGKIFINYRRGDTRGEAGRLMDSLTAYLGEGRVFRDIEGIEGGADFEQVLHDSVGSADALIILIGPQWLTITDDDGQRRLDDPDDWVAKEISSALDKGLPIFPVLVENAQMPHADELPDALKPLVRFNAISISDYRWSFDVTRLAKIIAFDLPGSVAEQQLNLIRNVVNLSLLISMLLTTALVVWNARSQLPLLELWQSGLSFVPIVGSSVLLLVFARLLDKSKRIYFYLSGLTGLIGSLLFYVLVFFAPESDEPLVLYFGSTALSGLMFVFMNYSGFKVR